MAIPTGIPGERNRETASLRPGLGPLRQIEFQGFGLNRLGTCHSVGCGASLVFDRDRQNPAVAISDRVAEWFCVHRRSVHVPDPGQNLPIQTPRRATAPAGIPRVSILPVSNPWEPALRYSDRLRPDTEAAGAGLEEE